MGNKCKICGYRFKSKDEEICPECFTAREDDISCGKYAKSEHSHRSTYSSGLRDTGESFVQKELRKERNNQFARENFGDRANAGLDLSRAAQTYDRSRFVRDDYNYDFSKEYRQVMSQSYPDQPQPQAQQTAYQRFTAQQQRKQQQSGFTPAGQIFAQRNDLRNQTYRPYNNNQKKKSGASGFAFLFIFIFVCIAVIAISADEEENKNSSNKNKSTVQYTTTTKSTTKRTTTSKTTTQGTTSKLEKDVAAVNSTLGHIQAKITDANFETKNKADIDKKLLGAAHNGTEEKEPWEIVTINVELSTTDKALTDPKNTTISSTTMQCLENESANNTMSYSVWSVNEDIDLSGGKVNTTITLLAHKDAKLMYFNIYFRNAGVTETCRFKITRD